MTNEEFYLKHIECLEGELKRLKQKNKDTLKIKVAIGNEEPYEVDTQLVMPRKPSKYYYIPNDYKDPTRVYFVDYNIVQSVENTVRIMATVSINNKLMDMSPQLLFDSKDKAGDYYLEHKEELKWDRLERR